jgi:SAM-dependent methyltransferase
VEHARGELHDGRVTFVVAGAEGLPGNPPAFDVVVSGLVLNFLADPAAAIKHMKERLRSGGRVGAYVWDYGEGMQFLRCFWDAAAALDPTAAVQDEGRRFPLCRPEALSVLFERAGLTDVAVEALAVPTQFAGFDDFWTPFLRGTGPAPSYAASLSREGQATLRESIGEFQILSKFLPGSLKGSPCTTISPASTSSSSSFRSASKTKSTGGWPKPKRDDMTRRAPEPRGPI